MDSVFRFDPDEPRDEQGRWSGDGDGGSGDKPSAGARVAIGKFVAEHVKDVAHTVGQKLKENQRELLAGAVTASLYHLAGADFPMDVEEQIHDQVVHFAENASVAVGVAREYMQKAVDALIARHTKKMDDDDPVLKALLGLKHVLANSKMLDAAEKNEKNKAAHQRATAMPIKPGKDESQSEWMARCVPEMIGTGDDKRPQDQAVAACMQIWRDKEKQWGDDAADVPEPDDDESREDFMDRCTGELEDLDEDRAEELCAMAWEDATGDEGDDFYFSAEDLVRKKYDRTQEPTATGEYILSDESVDSFDDIVSSSGWQLDAFRSNPVALFSHVPHWPIGTWHDVRVEDGKLRGRLELLEKGKVPRVDEIRALVEAGILKGVSVGFRALEAEQIIGKDGKPTMGRRFTKQQLVEASLVSIPANSNALAVAKSLHVSPQTLRMVFAKNGKRDRLVRRGLSGKHARRLSRNGKGVAMSSLAQRITELQAQIVGKTDALAAHLDKMDDTNVSDVEIETTNQLNRDIAQLKKTHLALVESEKLIGAGIDGHGAVTPRGRALVTTGFTKIDDHDPPPVGAPVVLRKSSRKEPDPIEYLVRAGTAMRMAKHWNISPDEARARIYGADRVGETEALGTWVACALTFGPQSIADELVLRAVHNTRNLTDEQFYTRAASAPAMTTVAGWASDLVRQIYTDLMPLLFPGAILPRLSAKGMSLSFGQAGRIIIPTRNATPTLAGSFVGEGQAIPVRQGAFSSQTVVPKKVAVITTWSKEIDEYSVPAIEGVLRDALQLDTAVAVDTILVDANPATVIRPAGLLNGLVSQTPTALGTGNQPVLTAIVGDLNVLIGALAASTKGNIRSPVWLMNPQEVLGASLALSALGAFPFRDEIRGGTLNNIPVIDSAVVPPKTVILMDAADFVVVGAEGIRLDLSDQASLHMEDTSPTDLVGAGSPPVVAAPQRSLFQTDSIALRLIFRLNWLQRRAGTIFFTANVNW